MSQPTEISVFAVALRKSCRLKYSARVATGATTLIIRAQTARPTISDMYNNTRFFSLLTTIRIKCLDEDQQVYVYMDAYT